MPKGIYKRTKKFREIASKSRIGKPLIRLNSKVIPSVRWCKNKRVNKAEYQRLWRKQFPELARRQDKIKREKYKFKKSQYPKVHYAIKKKILIKPKFCSVCKKRRKLFGHHNDYNKPLQVIWLCVDCHQKYHISPKSKGGWERRSKMGKASYDMTEVRFIIKPDFTECYVFCEAYGDCPIGVQGWHYKVFPKDVPIIDIIPQYITECVLWTQKSPEEN